MLGAAAADARLLPKLTVKTVATDYARPAGLLSDAQLESARARVGQIRFESRQLFDADSGDNGLRGYPLRYQAGAGRWLSTAEQRVFTNWFPFQLFNVGGAVFYDMGQTWGRDPLATRSQGLLKDVGFGLRLGNSRSALGKLLHIDVAFPLDGDSSIKNVQFVVETKRRF